MLIGGTGRVRAPRPSYPSLESWEIGVIDENMRLDERQKRRVLELVRERGVTCGSCGLEDFEVGEALELGMLWYNEKHETFMVALRCGETDCDTPAGIRLHESEFLQG